MQLANARSAEAYRYDARVARRDQNDADAPLSPRACLAVWAVIAGCGWGAIALIAQALG